MNDLELPADHRIGANYPPEPLVAAEDQRVADLVEAATKWAEQIPVIEADEVAAVCADFINQLAKQHEAFDEERKAEREPHNRALKEIQNRWLPRLDRIDICLRTLKPLHRAWLRLKESRLKAEREAAELAAAEAQRDADQLAEQAQAGGPGTVTNMIAATEATQRAERARQAVSAVPRRAQVRGNLGGRTHSLRSVWRAEVFNQDLLYAKLRDDRDVVALLFQKANAAARHGARPDDGSTTGLCSALPGCVVYESQE